MTYLTVPFMNIPLVLGLFNRENIGALLDEKLQCLLEWVLFEAGPFTKKVHAAVEVEQVPIRYSKPVRQRLGAHCSGRPPDAPRGAHTARSAAGAAPGRAR